MNHGRYAYRKGCRCDECRRANTEAMRAYVAKVKARDGVSPTQKARPRKSPTHCACGKYLPTGGQMCRACHWAGNRRRKRLASATGRANRAALGTQGKGRWVVGTCGECGTGFVRRGAVSTYCLAPCRPPAGCAWCGQDFRPSSDRQEVCSTRCKVARKHMRRRGREASAPGTYTLAEVTRLFLLFDRRCAYCQQTVVGPPDPDHVVPLSRGGSNSITNILPTCRLCNSDKRDLSLDEWAVDRARRGLPPIPAWSPDDQRYWHLTTVRASDAA